MKIFVTGGTGFLGHHFVLRALEAGHEVLCLRRTSSINRFPSLLSERIKWVIDDGSMEASVNEFAPDVLFHAAWAGVRGPEREEEDVQARNIRLTDRFFRLYPYRQIISLGSQAEYGYYDCRISEEDAVKPISEYGKAKDKCRRNLQEYCRETGIEWQWIRIFTVFGELQDGGLIQAFTLKCLNQEKEFRTTEGCQKYSYLYSSDYADALCRIVGAKGKSGVYNLSQPAEIHSNREILEKIKAVLKSPIEIKYGTIPYSENQIMLMDGTVEKFESQFGAIPNSKFDLALESTIKSYLNL
ncbi:MAG: NAD(P)-dependent oxidoreductase [Bacteroides sp.]|nr:NAD(P)-dependent oxidoreductase [Ruminococcus flavefaciens]MCM1554822.1 NAD(P)-dependent oxidoreductase [Bacteroides sp.]